MNLAQALEHAWYRGAWWLWLLRPLECLFRIVIATRRQLYRHGVLASYRAEVPVVVVGNITVGGTGKTPVVLALVEALQARGLRPGMVSRGYGGQAPHYPYCLDEHSSARESGDEALLVYRRTGAPCVVAADRPAAVRYLLEQAGVDVVLSDDGLQHYALARDFEIALLDHRRGVGNGWCLPAGPLREPVARLGQVDRVLTRGSGQGDDTVVYRFRELVNIDEPGRRRAFAPPAASPRVHAVAGIGQPGQFFDSLREAGFAPVEHRFADHHPYTAADFADLADAPIIMTEKDAVKCAGLAGANAWYLPISAELPGDLLDAVCELAKVRRA